MLAIAVGVNLSQLRVLAGMTQGDVEGRSGIHRPIISRIERGMHLPTIPTVYRYCAAVGFDPAHALRCVDDLQEELFG